MIEPVTQVAVLDFKYITAVGFARSHKSRRLRIPVRFYPRLSKPKGIL
jgi:hypothetical protein